MKKQLFDFAKKQVKKTIMSDFNSERSKHADSVVRNHMVWSMGMSVLVPIPIADIFAVSAVQLDMIRQLCKVYDKDFSETQGKAIVTALSSSTLARAGARSLVKLIPGIGTIVGGVAVSIFNGASTYAIGEVFKKHFESGGTILDFDTERLKKLYKEKFEKGKKMAEQVKKEEDSKKEKEPTVKKVKVEVNEEVTVEATAAKTEPVVATSAKDEILGKLKELADLKKQGVISEEEFQEMKKKLIDSF
ncbi:MAG: DUF697 domain-containing protein [Lewinella sp.]|nr:DUF697 domain-containing protein [Lewinella sp.]